jgi:thymidine kinase
VPAPPDGATDKVIFDEVQFFDKDKVKEVVNTLKKQGVHVIVSGLLYDFRRHPFGATSELIGLADESCELLAVCQKCGSFARHSERVSGSQSQIEVGESDKYLAVCEKCHVIYGD